MFAGFNGEPQLFTTDVTGNYLKYKANAIGENDEKIRDKLRENYRDGMSVEEGIRLALGIFRDIQGEEFNVNRFDIGIIGSDKRLTKKSGEDFA